jgi:hypothetical protein
MPEERALPAGISLEKYCVKDTLTGSQCQWKSVSQKQIARLLWKNSTR